MEQLDEEQKEYLLQEIQIFTNIGFSSYFQSSRCWFSQYRQITRELSYRLVNKTVYFLLLFIYFSLHMHVYTLSAFGYRFYLF
jgi:hypothetical protein